MERKPSLAGLVWSSAESPRRTKKRVPTRLASTADVLPQPHAVWAVDCMSDPWYGGRRFRTVNALDEGVREGVSYGDGYVPPHRTGTPRVWRGQPQALRVNNGLELGATSL